MTGNFVERVEDYARRFMWKLPEQSIPCDFMLSLNWSGFWRSIEQ